MRVAVLGSTGQLGTDLVEVLMRAGNYEVRPLSHREVDCGDPAAIEKTLKTAEYNKLYTLQLLERGEEAKHANM